MKKFYALIIPFIMLNNSLYSMLVPKKIFKLNKLQSTRHNSTTNKLLTFNALAGVTGTILGTVTGDPSYALPLVPHILSSINLCADTLNRPKPTTQFEQDFEVLINNKPSIFEEANNIKNIDSQINNLQEEVKLTSTQLDRLNLIGDYENKITALKQQKNNAIENLLCELSPLFKLHKITDIAMTLQNIQNNTPSIKTYEPISFCFNIGYLIFVPINIVTDGSFTDLALAFCLLNAPLTVANLIWQGEMADKEKHLRYECEYKKTVLETLQYLKQTHYEQFKKLTE